MDNKIPVSKMKNSELRDEIIRLNNELINNGKKIEAFDTLELKYKNLKAARLEDAGAVEQAKLLSSTLNKREHDLMNSFQDKIKGMNVTIQEQNETVVNLFEMIDNSIQQQIFYYQKFRNIYLTAPVPQNDEIKK